MPLPGSVPPDGPCKKCGQLHVRVKDGLRSCNGHNQTGAPCQRRPTSGTTVCIMHGGRSPAVRKKARERAQLSLVEGKVAKLLREVDMPAQHPLDGLVEVVRHSGAMMRMLAGLVGELDLHPDDQTLMMSPEGDLRLQRALYGPNHTGDGVPHALLTLYGVWSERYAKACKLALDANIDERVIRNAESTSEKMFSMIGKAVQAAQLSDDQRLRLQAALAAELRRYTGVAMELGPDARLSRVGSSREQVIDGEITPDGHDDHGDPDE